MHKLFWPRPSDKIDHTQNHDFAKKIDRKSNCARMPTIQLLPLFPSIFCQCSLVSQNPWETLETRNTVRVHKSHWDFGFTILYCVNTNTTQILAYCTSHLSLLDYDNPQEKHDERLRTNSLLDFLTSTWQEQRPDSPVARWYLPEWIS